jgi:hypothetical protein
MGDSGHRRAPRRKPAAPGGKIDKLPQACSTSQADPGSDAFTDDASVWGDELTPAGGIGVSDMGFTVGQELLILASGGSGPVCVAVYGEQALDVAQYPNAATDMVKLRAFVAARTDYEALIAADRLVQATVTGAGPQVPDAPGEHHVDLTISDVQPLCGNTSTPVTVRYSGFENQGINNPAWRVAPSVGSQLVMLIGPGTRGVFSLSAVYSADQWSRLAASFETPPALSL